MLYKEKILVLHKNSVVQDRISEYLREKGFAVITVKNVENAAGLVENMGPDLILWGKELNTKSREIIKDIKNSHSGNHIPVIALVPDMELFDRIEIEKSGINDIMNINPNFSELKVKIRFHLLNRDRIKNLESDVRHMVDISQLQYNLIRVHDVSRLCELVNDFLLGNFHPTALITTVFNKRTGDFDYNEIINNEIAITDLDDSIFQNTIWKQKFIYNPNHDAGQVIDKEVLAFFKEAKLDGDLFYHFPMQTSHSFVGFVILGFKGNQILNKIEFEEINTLAQSMAFRIINNRRTIPVKEKPREETANIHQLFKMLNEDEISNSLSIQLINHLNADICIYFNYNEGFRFLYPQNCYKSRSEKNLFENEKPTVLMVDEYPTFIKFMDSKKPSAHFNLDQEPAEDIRKMAAMANGEYQSIILFSVYIGNKPKGFFVVANQHSRKLFTTREIQSAGQIIQRATNILRESRVIKQAQKTIKQLDRVFDLGKELTLDIELDEILFKIANSVRRTLGWNIVILEKYNFRSNHYENMCVLGLKETTYKNLRDQDPFKKFNNHVRNCFSISQSFFWDNEIPDGPQNEQENQRFHSTLGEEWNDKDWLFIPILSKGKELGYFAVNDPVERIRPTVEKVRSIEYFANQAAVAIENTLLYDHLKSSEEKYRLLAETMIMGLVTCDFNGNILYVNNSLLQMLKYVNSADLMKKNLFNLSSVKTKGELKKYILQLFKQNTADPEIQPEIDNGVEIELKARDNHYIPFKLFVTSHSDVSNEEGFVGVLSDLRPQRRLENLRTDFNSMIVHDLRSPLNIIQGYIDIVKSQAVGALTDEQGDLLQIAKDNVDKVLKLVDSFMIASKIESGKFDMVMDVFSINTLIQEVCEHNKVLAAEKDLEISMSLDSNISLQQFDRLRIEQVMTNYISNAIKFTENGGKINITSKLVKTINELTSEESMSIQVSVSDTGVGIPPEEQNKVFSKYEQTEAGKDASLKGTGLGLAICKEIMSMHNGEVWVQSEPEEGSTFFFSLPFTPIQV